MADRVLRRITHVIFDCDGLLLDTEGVYTQCIQQIVGRYGKTFDWTVKKAMMGRPLPDASRVALEMMQISLHPDLFVGASVTAKLLQELQPLLAAGFAQVPAMPGVERLVRHLHRHNIPMAIATSSHKDHFEIKASRHQSWLQCMQVIVTGDDPLVKRGKPAPDIYEVAAARLNASPSSCLVFEDAPNGVVAARAAGMAVVAVPDPNVEHAEVQLADLVLRSLEHFEPSAWGLPPF